MSDSLTNLLTTFSAAQITDFFISLIMFIAVLTVFLAYKGLSEAFVRYAPSLLTSLGILGTFTGIVIGLYYFDTVNIDKSIPLLLDGLKAAFMTSLVGIGSALILKVILTHPFKQISDSEINDDVDASDLLKAINFQGEQLVGLREAVAGDETSSLTGQIKLLRSDSNESSKKLLLEQRSTVELLTKLDLVATAQQDAFGRFSEKLWMQMQDFADMLSKSATETVIEALKEVISDFNKNLTEQFGENFKELNSAVLKLVTWQDEYRVQLEQMAVQYAQGVEAITKTEASVGSISREAEKIPLTMSELKTIIEVNQHQLNELSNHLEAFKDMRDKAVEAVPEIHAQIDKTISDLGHAVEGASEHYKVMLDKSGSYLESHSEKSEDLLQKLTTTSERGLKQLEESFKEGASDIVSGLSDGGEAMKGAIEEAAGEFNNNVNRVNESLQGTADFLTDNGEKMRLSLSESAEDIQSKLSMMLSEMDDNSKSIIVNFKETGTSLLEQNSEIILQTTSGIEDMRNQLQISIEQTISQQANSTDSMLTGMAEKMGGAVQRTEGNINSQLEAMDEALEAELVKVLNVMGQNLTSITQKFTDDYKMLTESMHQVVRESKRFDS